VLAATAAEVIFAAADAEFAVNFAA